MGALDGIRVIDFGQYIAGPLAGVMLADQGADVIHVDPPGGPQWKSEADAFLQRGKRRISLDLKDGNDRDTASRLIDGADVVIENFRPGVMERLGLGADAATQRNAGLIYTSIPGFAPDDPRAGMQAWEGILDAATDNCIPRAGEETPNWDWSRPFYSAVTLASNFGGFLGATGDGHGVDRPPAHGLRTAGRGARCSTRCSRSSVTRGAYVNQRGLHAPRGIHGRGAGAFRCEDGKYVQFDTSSARHLVWFAQEAGITGWGPELLDIVRLRDEKVNQQLHARLRELFLTRTAGRVGRDRQPRRRRDGLGAHDRRMDCQPSTRAQHSARWSQLDDPEFGPTWMAGLPVHLTATPERRKGRATYPTRTTTRCSAAGRGSPSHTAHRTRATRRSLPAARHESARSVRRARRTDLRAIALRVRRRRRQDQCSQSWRGRLPESRQTRPCC